MKKILGFFLLSSILLSWIIPVFAQNDVAPTILESDVRTCAEHEMKIYWPTVTKRWVDNQFFVESSVPWWVISSISHEIWSWPDLLQSYDSSKATHVFPDQWKFLVKTLLTTTDWCTYVAQDTVNVYDRVFVYLWPWSDEYDLVKDSLQKEGTFFGVVKVSWDSLQLQNQVVDELIKNKSLLESADVLLMDSQSLWVVLWSLPDVEKTVPISLDNAHVYVLSSINQSAFRRLIATYRSLVWLKEISVIPQNNVWSLVSALLLDKNPEELWMIKKFTTDTWSSNRIFAVSYLVDSLLLYEVPLQFIVFLLLIPVLVLVITFFRQVVWFTIFGMASSLLLWLAIYTLWIWPSLLLLLAWWLAVLTTAMITERVYVLSTPKLASSIFRNSWSLFSKKWFIGLIQWWIVIASIVMILRWNWLQNVLLWYPELVLFALLSTFFVWRYTWLQATEYVRFMPLITWTMKDHEEEEE